MHIELACLSLFRILQKHTVNIMITAILFFVNYLNMMLDLRDNCLRVMLKGQY